MGNITLASQITNAGLGSLTYAGTGLLTLGGPGSFGGGLIINAGCSVQITSGGFKTGGAGIGTITINGNGNLILSNNGALANTNVIGGSTSTMTVLVSTGNLWLTNSLTNFTGVYNASSPSGTAGQVVVGSAATVTPNINVLATWNINPGVVVDFNGFQTNPAPVNLYGLPYVSAGDGALRLDASVQTGNVVLYGNSEIGNGDAAGASLISGIISDVNPGYGFVKMGAYPVELTAANTYRGNTVISNGTLSLSNSGSINSSAEISISPAGFFDVSGLSSTTFTLSSSTTLAASGTGIATNTGAFIKGASGGVVNLGSQPISLTFTPTGFTGDTTHPSLDISQGSLTLSGNAITVNNAAATPLGVGTYTLIQTPGAITGVPATATTVSGSGIAAGTAASISVSGSTVVLTVAVSSAPTHPTITGVSLTAGSLVISATNGTPSGNYRLLSTTNLAIPETNWTVVATGSFNAGGNITLTNAVNTNITPQFFIIQNP